MLNAIFCHSRQDEEKLLKKVRRKIKNKVNYRTVKIFLKSGESLQLRLHYCTFRCLPRKAAERKKNTLMVLSPGILELSFVKLSLPTQIVISLDLWKYHACLRQSFWLCQRIFEETD